METSSKNIKGVAAFLLITFGVAWAIWIPGLLWTGLSGVELLGSQGQALILSGAFAPALAAWVVRKWVTGEGFADAGLRPGLRGWPYYLFALFWPLVAVAVIVSFSVIFGIGQPDFSLVGGLNELVPGSEGQNVSATGPPLPAVVILSLFFSVFLAPLLWGEEFGWRGYLQVRLFAEKPLLAATAVGLIWGVWHYPLVLAGYGFSDQGSFWGLLFYPVSCVLLSIIFGWLRTGTGGVWAPTLAHSAHNQVGASLLILLFAGGPQLVLVGALGGIPYGALCLWLVLSGRLKSG